MAQYKIHDPEDEMICPYDPNHRPRARIFQTHLISCRKNNPHMKLQICHFNATHHVPRSEFRYHLMTCPDKVLIEHELSYAAREGQVLGGCTDLPVYKERMVTSSEDWDSEISDQTNTSSSRSQLTGRDVTHHETSNLHQDRLNISSDTRHSQPREQIAPSSPHRSSLPLEQPISSIYAYSVGRGRGRCRRIQESEQTSVGNHGIWLGRGRAMRPRQASPPPGFSVSLLKDSPGKIFYD